MEVVQDIGLAGTELAPGYLSAGPRFLDYLSFLGCAPTVVFDPPSDDAIGGGQFYHLSVQPARDEPLFRSDALSYKPKCPHCRHPLDDWRTWWGGGGLDVQACPACGESVQPGMIAWRRRAGLGRVFIDILGIHADTVKPVSALFDDLARHTGTDWLYFFVEDAGA